MPKPLSKLSPEEAGRVYRAMKPTKGRSHPTDKELHAELCRRGTPVSLRTIAHWRKANWTRRNPPVGQRSAPVKASIVQEACAAAERVGLPEEVVRDLEARLTAMHDGELVVHVTRALLINSALLMEQAKHMTPELMRSDPRGLAALNLAAGRMVEEAHDLMSEARNLAERAMKEKSLVLAPDARPLDPSRDRANVRSFAGLLEKFSSIKPPIDGGPGDVEEDPTQQYIPPLQTTPILRRKVARGATMVKLIPGQKRNSGREPVPLPLPAASDAPPLTGAWRAVLTSSQRGNLLSRQAPDRDGALAHAHALLDRIVQAVPMPGEVISVKLERIEG